jgi:2-haloacid dehalogenase
VGDALSQAWRAKQLEYSWLRAMSGRWKPFWDVTRDALRHACERLALPLDDTLEARLMNQYASLSAFPENLEALRALKALGLPLGHPHERRPRDDRRVDQQRGHGRSLRPRAVVRRARTFKTADAIYALGPAAFGLRARDILFVSSNGWDAASRSLVRHDELLDRPAGAPARAARRRAPTSSATCLTDVLRCGARRARPAAPPDLPFETTP